MKTVLSTNKLFFAAHTDESPSVKVPKGKVHVYTVKYEIYEIDEKDFEAMTVEVHDSNSHPAVVLNAVMNGV